MISLFFFDAIVFKTFLRFFSTVDDGIDSGEDDTSRSFFEYTLSFTFFAFFFRCNSLHDNDPVDSGLNNAGIGFFVALADEK